MWFMGFLFNIIYQEKLFGDGDFKLVEEVFKMEVVIELKLSVEQIFVVVEVVVFVFVDVIVL